MKKGLIITFIILIAVLGICLIRYTTKPYTKKDADRILEIDLGYKKATPLDYIRLDVNNDKEIDLYDGVLILRKLDGKYK